MCVFFFVSSFILLLFFDGSKIMCLWYTNWTEITKKECRQALEFNSICRFFRSPEKISYTQINAKIKWIWGEKVLSSEIFRMLCMCSSHTYNTNKYLILYAAHEHKTWLNSFFAPIIIIIIIMESLQRWRWLNQFFV